jgi:hypothetical protein
MHQHAATIALAKAKLQVASQLAVLSNDTVLYEMTGQTTGSERSTDSVNSYFSIQEGVTNKNTIYADKYKQFVIDYAQEWYTTITTRVGEGLKKAEMMRVELDHYQSKVESLRQSANSTMAKGKQVDGKAAEKLTRNEDKLIKIKEASSKFINDLCLLMEEVTERSWRDLHPLLIKCSQFELQVSSNESKALSTLSVVVTALKKVASDHGIKPQARLKDLEKLDPHQLSTRSKDDTRNIEAGFSGMALGGISGSASNDGSAYGGNGSIYSALSGVPDTNASYFPPGSTSGQGLGGFPVRVQSSDNLSASNSNGNTPSTMNMMSIHTHAAPAPTLDTMEQAFGGGNSNINSNGVPSYGRKASNDTMHSDFSGAPAPPPSAAPPPPPPPATPGVHNDPFGAPASGLYGVSASSAPSPFGGMTSPSPYGAPSPMMGSYPQQSPTVGGNTYGQHQQQQSPMAPMGGGYGQQQRSPMGGGGGYGQQQQQQQQSPIGGGFSQQQSPMGGGGSFSQQNYAQQRTPMGGSMYGSPAPQQQHSQHKRSSAPAAYGHNPSNPFG